jgi:hypothetical protein
MYARNREPLQLPIHSHYSDIITMRFHHHHHRRALLLLRAADVSSSSNSNRAKRTSTMKRLPPLVLTRRQKLRLTPKDRAIYLRYHEQSHQPPSSISPSSLLESARSNVRFNVQYLKSNANTNLRKNIQTMKRLFNGEEVWKDHHADDLAPSTGGALSSRTASLSSSAPTRLKPEAESTLQLNNIDWERLPAEIISNVKRNTTYLSEWIHDVSGGKIPAFSRTPPPQREDNNTTTSNNSTGEIMSRNDGGYGGSIATRIRNFHIMKQDDDTILVMDKYWIAKNIFIALLPGFLLHLYFLSLQDEMAEYYGKIEQMERERILGIETGKENVNSGASDVLPLKNECIRNREQSMMGISSALIPEGGTSWDKLKLAVNDLFLGSVEKRVGNDQSLEVEVEEDESKDELLTDGSLQGALVTDPTVHSVANSSSPVNQLPQEVQNDDNDDDVTVQMLLQRIRALEAHIANSNIEEEELERRRQHQQQLKEEEHRKKRQVERVKQSPIKNRRDNVLEAKWKNEAKNDESSFSSGGGGDNEVVESDNSFGLLVDVANSAWLTIAPHMESAKDVIIGKLTAIVSFALPSVKKVSIQSPCTNNTETDECRSSTVRSISSSTADGGESDMEVNVSSVACIARKDVRNVIENSIDEHHDENIHFDDRATRGHWAMNLWRRMRNSPSSTSSSSSPTRSVPVINDETRDIRIDANIK